MEKYLKIIQGAYTGYFSYFINEMLNPSWHNYFYWLVGASLAIWLLEIMFPWRKNQPLIREHFWLDAFYLLWNYFLFSLIAYNALSMVAVELFNDFLGLFGIVIALTPKTDWMLVVGAGGLVGLAGWWLRVFVSLPTLTAHPLLRWTVCGALAIGVAAITYTLLTWPDAYAWRQFLYPIGLTGLLLFVGTLASWQGPNY